MQFSANFTRIDFRRSLLPIFTRECDFQGSPLGTFLAAFLS